MTTKAFELAEGWPHKHLNEFPDEVHISPRTAYFTRDGKVMALRVEDMDAEKVHDANEQLVEEGFKPEEIFRVLDLG